MGEPASGTESDRSPPRTLPPLRPRPCVTQAAIKDQEVQAQRMATLIAAEKERQRALLQDQAALAGMAAYQADAVQVLNLGALGERVEGEVALVGDQTWQQLMGMPMSKPEEAAGRASITTQSSAELTSAASAGSGFPAAQHGAHAQQAATTSSGTAATAATEEAARSGSKAGGGGFMQWLYGTVGAAGEAAAPSSGGDVDSLRRKWMQRMVDMTVLDKFWFVFLTEIPSWVMK